ncbi:Spo0E family sporulation regulatory protein-aspartic acid phosphatase [Maledivibacter halophilus]|uniref:Spo0E like sporulation regulatory protein n=1 Tax=Maledivibacter halophilus TaxID=36842 RepID=A0A1T5K6R7_9FIRM|nr:Spo0E family sporulation regulatory protein-aspartic acid phosphatase [Maledivibacter halophilus]SKC59235.1 Spo0E like sporulation regulatory protein [Maledivibacter halophilus]
MIKRKNKDGIKGLSEEELEEKINELRMKLNKAIESNIDKDELVNISQELDQYIVLKQKKL